jgi:hypothetical protein
VEFQTRKCAKAQGTLYPLGLRKNLKKILDVTGKLSILYGVKTLKIRPTEEKKVWLHRLIALG